MKNNKPHTSPKVQCWFRPALAAKNLNPPITPPPRPRCTSIAGHALLGLVAAGLLLCGNASARIALQDGSLAITTITGSKSVSLNNFTVTPGASVLVVSLVDRNNDSTGNTPATLSWGSQTLSQLVSVNGAGGTWAWANIYYLFNPAPGTQTITATDPSLNTPSVMAIQAYTLSGVDTSVAPVPYSTNGNPVGSLTLPFSTPILGWAAVCSHYGTTTGGGYQLSATGGALSFTRTSVTIQEAMGYVADMNGNAVVTGRDTAGGTQKMALGVAVFAPALPGPAAPTSLTAVDGQTNKVTLSWTDGSSGAATSYVIWRWVDGNSPSPIATNAGNANVTYTDTSVSAWTTYNYSVQAVAADAGGFSPSASATPVGAPLAPSGVTVAGVGDSAVLNWSAPAGTISYNVLRSSTSGSGYSSVATGVTSAPYTNTALTLNTAYYYVVQAVNALGTSPNSAEVGVTPLSAPNTVVATAATNSVKVSWKDTTGGQATGYLLFRSITSGGGANGYQLIATLPGNTTTNLTDRTVYTGYTYYYVVEATSANATSAASTQVSAAPNWVPNPGVPIAILDPFRTASTGAGVSTISMPFSVSAGAAALVFTLSDANNNDSGTFRGPSMVWSNITLGITQEITVVPNAYASSHGYNYTWASVWCLTNPLPGIGVLIGTETPAPQIAMYAQAYTLVGVDTTAAPEGLGAGAASSTTQSVTTSPSTVANSWSQVLGVSHNGGGGNDIVISCTSGTIVQTNYRAWGAQTTFGYVSNMSPGSATITVTGTGSPTLTYLAEATFAPLVTLATPQNVTATGQNNQIALSWSAVGGATSYKILRTATSGLDYSVIATNVGNGSLTYTDTAVNNYTTYYYVIQAAAGTSVSLYSAEVSAFATGLPGLLFNVRAVADVNQVDLSWTDQNQATGYNVYRSLTSGGTYSLVGSPGTASFIDTAVANGTRYFYEVSAVNVNGEGNKSTPPVSAIPAAAFFTNYIGNFQSESDVAAWSIVLNGTPTNVYIPGDIPPTAGPSAGALEMDAMFGPGTTGELQGIGKPLSPNFNVSTYQIIELDMYNSGPSYYGTPTWDQYFQISAVQLNLRVPVTGTPTYVRGSYPNIQLSDTGPGSGWTHFVAPLSDWSAYDLTQVSAFGINVLDFNFVGSATPVGIRYANIAFAHAPAWVPTISVANRTANSGSTSVLLQGTVSAIVGGAPVYLWTGTPITVTINGRTLTTAINDLTGDFSIEFNTTGFANGTYPVTYASALDMVSLLGATNSSTTLTLTTLPPPNQPTVQPPTLDSTGANMVLKTATQSGYNYYLLSTASLTPPVTWVTNSITVGTGGVITNLVPLDKNQRTLFLKYLVK